MCVKYNVNSLLGLCGSSNATPKKMISIGVANKIIYSIPSTKTPFIYII